jgi:hypothetical protein
MNVNRPSEESECVPGLLDYLYSSVVTELNYETPKS